MKNKSYSNFCLPQKLCRSPIAMYNLRVKESMKVNGVRQLVKKSPSNMLATVSTGESPLKHDQSVKLEPLLENPTHESEPDNQVTHESSKECMMTKYTNEQTKLHSTVDR